MQAKLSLKTARDVATMVNTMRELSSLSRSSSSFAAKIAAMPPLEQRRLACEIYETMKMLWPITLAECEVDVAIE